ncbi:MAG: YugE family protein [Treponema sp.]|jgi:hypothetical protein|nr:YugE family protein [Treponema sp.]
MRRNKWHYLFEVVKKSIDKWDPYGLLKNHCPDDEFDSESKIIANKINLENSIYEIANIISKTFTNSFNEPERFSVENCLKVAEKIKVLMEDGIFYSFVNYYNVNCEIDDHFRKFNLLLEDLKNEYESNVIDRKYLYNKLVENITEGDKWYTGCHQMIERLKEWSNT